MRVWKKIGISTLFLGLAAVGTQAGPLADATADALWGIEIGGFIDIAYNYNFNDPDSEFNQTRLFDEDHDEFNLHLFQLYLDRLPEEVGDVGFRVDIGVGEDAGIFVNDEFDNDDEFSLYQAYISYIAPIGNGLTVDLGRWVTPYGYEVIESPANDHYSRSYMFQYIPWTHTGLRLTYPINDQFELLGAVSQGWDQVEDNNDSVSFHAALRWTPMETLYIQNAISYGPEWYFDFVPNPAGGMDNVNLVNDSDYTFFYDLVVSYDFSEVLNLGANFDWGNQERGALNMGDYDWWGVALYGRYDINEQLYTALRGEYFDDYSGRATGNFGGIEYWEVTATLGYEITDGLQARLEFRHDDADSPVFDDDNGTDDTQNTIAAEVIYSF